MPSRNRKLRSASTREVDVLVVVDGETLVVRDQDRFQLVELRGVDAPELDQPHGDEARAWLAATLVDRRIQVRPGEGDGCTWPVEIRLGAEGGVAESLLRAGLAWAEPTAPEAWHRLEAAARRRRAGLWERPGAQPPWEFRRRRMESKR